MGGPSIEMGTAREVRKSRGNEKMAKGSRESPGKRGGGKGNHPGKKKGRDRPTEHRGEPTMIQKGRTKKRNQNR